MFRLFRLRGRFQAADGGGRVTLEDAGFAPSGHPDGAILFHTASYRVMRRRGPGAVDDLGDGAFARFASDGRVVFQCDGLGGGVCRMNADGSGRETLRAAGRAPDMAASGELLFHTDAYRVIKRAPDGGEDDLGDGAFPTWAPDGRVVFQCDGLGGGLCRMNADGSGRETLSPSGRAPRANAAGEVLFHTDAYVVSIRSASGAVNALGAGANATWM